MESLFNNVRLEEGIYWVGTAESIKGLRCNPYLLIDGEEAVLFDPGSVLDFEEVLANVKKLIPLEKVRYVVLHHQDPDFCSGVPLFEKAGANFTIVTQWRTETIIRYYGITSPYYLVDEHNYRLKLASGRELQFVATPYLHFPGAIATYDPKTGILFSSDLFGAFSMHTDFYAGDDYIEKMKTFHEHYMPANEILRPVMETFLLMDIRMIAPQHGSVINRNIPEHIKALRDLECGVFLNPVKKNIKKSGGYAGICSIVLKRYAAIFGEEELREAIADLDMQTEGTSLEITDYNYTGLELWEKLFETIFRNKGIKWIVVIEPLAKKLSAEYELPVPAIFRSEIRSAREETMLLTEELQELKEINERLSRNIEQTQGKITTCPVTGLYNQTFFKEYMKTELDLAEGAAHYDKKALILAGIDNIARIKFLFGDGEADNILKGLVYILKGLKEENQLLFRLDGYSIACYAPNMTLPDAAAFGETIRNEIRTSGKFVEEITVSIGIAGAEECRRCTGIENLSEFMQRAAQKRLLTARSRGGNLVISESVFDEDKKYAGNVLIADSDAANRDVLKNFLLNLKYSVITAADGEEALALAEREMPDLILSEIMLPKIDGFVLCEKLQMHSTTKDIPFIIVSNLKNEDSVKRAVSLGIEHYFQKPYMMTELLGIVKRKVKGEESYDA